MANELSTSLFDDFKTNMFVKRSAAEEQGFNTLSPGGVATPAGDFGADLMTRPGAVTPSALGQIQGLDQLGENDKAIPILEKMLERMGSLYEQLDNPENFVPPEPKNFAQRYTQRLARASNPYYDQERKNQMLRFRTNAKIQVAQNIRAVLEDIQRRQGNPLTRDEAAAKVAGRRLGEVAMDELLGPEPLTEEESVARFASLAHLLGDFYTPQMLVDGGVAKQEELAMLTQIKKSQDAEKKRKEQLQEKTPKKIDPDKWRANFYKTLDAQVKLRMERLPIVGEYGDERPGPPMPTEPWTVTRSRHAADALKSSPGLEDWQKEWLEQFVDDGGEGSLEVGSEIDRLLNERAKP